ncbi:MAG: IS1595 family transposase [Nitrospinota bacterium]
MNLIELIERYRDEDKCRKTLEELRWPEGIECPRCREHNISPIEKRGQHHCLSCGYHFSVTVGTIFHDTHLPLWKWFITVYMMVESRKGVSANQIKRTLGVGYKTAWYLCHRIRAAMAELNAEQLNGTVEVDETLVGGKVRGKGRGFKGNKAIVVGAIQRDGKVRLKVIEGTDKKTLHKFIREHTADDTELIITDEWPAYKGIGDHNTKHETVNHSEEEWVRGDVHTNTIEGVWSLLNRSVIGTFHKISAKHLDAYLDELEWRFNNRKNPYLLRVSQS